MSDINLEQYLRVAWRWLWLIILVTGISAGISYRVSKSITPIYRTATTLQVGDSVTNPRLSMDDVNMSQHIAAGYSDLVQRQSVLQATADALRLPMTWRTLAGQVLVSHADLSQYFTIYVSDTNPQRAKAIADEVAHQLILQSPTADNAQQQQQRREFVQQQLDQLQANITQGEKQLATAQAALQKATSARDVLDRQDEIQALNDKLMTWRSTYASLLNPTQRTPPNGLSVVAPADVPVTPVSPDIRSNVFMAGAAGLLLSLGAVLAIEYMDDTIGDASELARMVILPALGSIGSMGRGISGPKSLITIREPHLQVSEAYRFLRTSLQFASTGDLSVPLIVTSPGPGEGKSVTSANLAVTFAQAGKQVILVDADLRHPSLHRIFEVANDAGLTSYLQAANRTSERGNVGPATESLALSLDRQLVPTTVPGVILLPGGPAVDNAAELLGSPLMAQLLETLRRMAEVVIFDSAPLVPVADTSILASGDAAVILVIEAGKTRSPALKLAVENLDRVRARILGIVLNKAPMLTIVPYRYGSRKDAAPTSPFSRLPTLGRQG